MYKCWTCTELYEAFTLLKEKMCNGLSTNSGDSYGHCAPLIADLFLFCYERHFMPDLPKSKQY